MSVDSENSDPPSAQSGLHWLTSSLTGTDELRTLVESFARAIWETDAEGRAVTDSPSWRAYTGQSVRAWLSAGWLGAVHPDDQSVADYQWQLAIQQRKPLTIDVRLSKGAGGWQWTTIHAVPIRAEQGSIQKWLGLLIDIADRKPVEEHSLHSGQLLRALSENLPGSAAFVVDQELRYQLAEGGALTDVGVEPSNYIGKTIFEALDTDTAATYEPYYRNALNGQPFALEHNVNGHSFWSKGVPLRDPAGSVYAVLAVSYDISEQKRIEQQLQQSEEQQAFLLKLADAIHPLIDPILIQEEACRVLGEYLSVDRVYYAELEPNNEYIFIPPGHYTSDRTVPITGRHPLHDLGTSVLHELRANRPVVVADTEALSDQHNLERTNSHFSDNRALLLLPLVKESQLVSVLGVTQSVPRAWSEQEVAIAKETAERTWAAVERARVQRALQQSEAAFRTISNAAPALVWVCAPTGENIYFNHRWYEYTGQTEEAAKGHGWTRAAHPDDWADLAPYWERCQQTGEPYEGEVRYRRHDGDYRWHVFRALPRYSQRGTIEAWYGVSVDTHDVKQAEAALRKSEEQKAFLLSLNDRLRSLADPAEIQYEASCALGEYLGANRVGYAEDQRDGQTIVVTRNYTNGVPGIEGRYQYNDYGATLMTDLQAGRIVVQSDIANDPTLSEAEKQAHSILQLGAAVKMPLVKGGQLVAVLFMHYKEAHEWSANELTLLEETGQRTWAAVERARAEADLRASEEKYRRLFNSIDEGFALCRLIYDATGQPVDFWLLDINPTFEAMTGISTEHAKGRTARQVVPSLDDWWMETYQRVTVDGEIYRFENWVEGMNRWFDVYAAPVGSSEGGLFTLVFKDITERKRREENAAFLADIGGDFARLNSADEIMQVVGGKIFNYFKLSRLLLTQIDQDANKFTILFDQHEPDSAAVADSYPVSSFINRSFLELNQTVRVVVSNDVTTDPNTAPFIDAYAALGIRAQLVAPFVSEGRWRFAITLAHSEPYAWRADQIELLEDLAPRLYLALERLRFESLRHLTLLQQTEDLAKVGSWEYSRATGQLTWSTGMYRLFSLDPGQPVEADKYVALAADADKFNARHLVTHLHEGDGTFESIMRLLIDGTEKTMHIKASVIGDGDQKRVLGVDLDITEQLLAQQQIQETADNLQAVLDGSPAAIGLLKAVRDDAVDRELITDFCLAVGNRKLTEFFNQPLDELLGQSVARFSSLLWGSQTMTTLLQVWQSGQSLYQERNLVGTGRWLAISVTRQDDGILLTGLNITELKAIQHRQLQWLSEMDHLRQSTDALTDLRASLAHRSELLRAVSHDLRGNFGVIHGAVELLGMAASEDDRAQILDMVLRNVKQATGLLTELLDYARLEAGQEQRTIAPLNAAQLVQELCHSLQPLAAEQKLWLQVEGPLSLVIDGDRLHIHRMAQNLIINALKYTHDGGVTVRWGEDPANSHWWFSVRDTGPGLDAELVARLTTDDTPNQADTASSAAKQSPAGLAGANTSWSRLRGEGIGLRIVRQLAILLNARLRVESQPGLGTEFVISFPLRYTENG